MFLKCRQKLLYLSKSSFHLGSQFFAVKNHYETLGLKDNANIGEIKSAYYKLSKLYHPDSNKDEKDTSKKFHDISEAYEILGNFNRKKLYDKGLTVPREHTTQQWNLNKSKIYRSHDGSSGAINEKLYDFDAWSRAHYGASIERRNIAKKRYYQKIKDKELNKELDKTDQMMALIIISMLFIFRLIAGIIDKIENVSRKDN